MRGWVIPMIGATAVFGLGFAARFARADESLRGELILSTLVTLVAFVAVFALVIGVSRRPWRRFASTISVDFPQTEVLFSFVTRDSRQALAALGERHPGLYVASIWRDDGL